MRGLFGKAVLGAFCALIALSITCACTFAQTASAPTTAAAPAAPAPKGVHVDRWLVLGPFQAPLPAFNAEAKAEVKAEVKAEARETVRAEAKEAAKAEAKDDAKEAFKRYAKLGFPPPMPPAARWVNTTTGNGPR